MSNGAGYQDFTSAMQAASEARAATQNQDAVRVLGHLALAMMRVAVATRQMGDQMHERIERLHHKIDRMERQVGSAR